MKAASGNISMVDEAVRQIVQAIGSGIYSPGQRLVEQDFMRRLAVSRSVLREAFQRLASEGVTEISLHRGASVSRLNRKQVDESFEIRAVLETLAAERAAPALHADPSKLIEIQNAFRLAAADADFDRYVSCNAEFHETIADACDNRILADHLRRLGNPLMQMQARRALTVTRARAAVAEHQAILTAFCTRDATALRNAVTDHVERSRLSLQTLGDAFFS